MIEDIENAKEEIKRIDHLIYVTLKYTRTVDVLMSVVERMINAYEFLIDALVKKSMLGGNTEELDNPIAKANFVIRAFPSQTISKNVKKYLLFRKIRRTVHEASNEFRRHVTLTTTVDDEEIQINIDNITEEYHAIKRVLEYVEKAIK